MPHYPHDPCLREPRPEMARVLYTQRSVPDRFLSLGSDSRGGYLAADGVVEEETSLLEALKGGLLDKVVLM